MTELKPCPFCGSDNISDSIGQTGDGKPWPYVECENCGASAEPDIWNRRDGRPAGADPEVVEALTLRCYRLEGALKQVPYGMEALQHIHRLEKDEYLALNRSPVDGGGG